MKEPLFSPLDGIVKVSDGSYWDYWFTENEILRVKLVSQADLILAVLPMAILGLLVALITIVIGIIVGVAGLFIVYAQVGRTAKKRRSRLEGSSIDDLVRSKIIDLRIPYFGVSRARLESGRVSIFCSGRRFKVKVPPGDLAQLDALLRSKLGDKLTVNAG